MGGVRTVRSCVPERCQHLGPFRVRSRQARLRKRSHSPIPMRRCARCKPCAAARVPAAAIQHYLCCPHSTHSTHTHTSRTSENLSLRHHWSSSTSYMAMPPQVPVCVVSQMCVCTCGCSDICVLVQVTRPWYLSKLRILRSQMSWAEASPCPSWASGGRMRSKHRVL